MPQAFSKGTFPTSLSLPASCPGEAEGSYVLGTVRNPDRAEAESGCDGVELPQQSRVELPTFLVQVQMLLGDEVHVKPSDNGEIWEHAETQIC